MIGFHMVDHDVIQLADMDEAVAHGAGHLGVDLRDQQVGALGGGLGIVAGNAKAAVAVLIGGAQVQQHYIGVQRGAEQLRNLAEEHRGKVAPSLLDRLAGAAAQKQAVVAEVLGILRQAVLRLAHCHHMHDFHILILLGICHHGVGQQDRLAGRMGNYHTVAGFNMLYRFLGGGQLLLIQGSPVLHLSHLIFFFYRFAGSVKLLPAVNHKFMSDSPQAVVCCAHSGAAAHHQNVLLPALSGGLYLPFGVPLLQLLYRGHPVIAWVAAPTVLYAYSHASPA